jgi:hypothetical protein
MNILSCEKGPLRPSPIKGRPIHPRLQRAGLSGPRSVKNILSRAKKNISMAKSEYQESIRLFGAYTT